MADNSMDLTTASQEDEERRDVSLPLESHFINSAVIVATVSLIEEVCC